MTPVKKRKIWRPSLAIIIASLLMIVISLPLASIFFFKIYDNQLVHETEAELIAQGVAFSALIKSKLSNHKNIEELLGPKIPIEPKDEEREKYDPYFPELTLSDSDILPPRPDAVSMPSDLDEDLAEIGKSLIPIIQDTQYRTLAGFRILDKSGRIISGRDDIGMSLAHIDEIKKALSGRYASVLRKRISDDPGPSLSSISRGARIRVFVAIPIIVEQRIAGVVYTSRTPSNALKQLYSQRWTVYWALGFIFCAASLIAVIFIRTIKRPIESLQAFTAKVGSLKHQETFPNLGKYSSREIFALSEALRETSTKLSDRVDYINIFASHVAHELKSPLTSIQGAVLLIQDDTNQMTKGERDLFLSNILKDTRRLTALLDRLRDLAKADNPLEIGWTGIDDLISYLSSKYADAIGVQGEASGMQIPIALENAKIVFSNLIENSIHHDATEIVIRSVQVGDQVKMTVSDNGSGISTSNREKIFDLFFTTRRETNGTGMGLGIIRAMLRSHNGNIYLGENEGGQGACFEITFNQIL